MSLQIVKLLDPIQMTISGTFTPKGAYNAATDYAVGDQVDYNGSSYIMYNNAGAGTVPTNTSYWGLVAEKGDTGATGATGPTGPAGADGADGVGVVAGGTTGQVLAKNSNTNYDTYWKDDAGGIADPGSNGILARTALNTTSARTITGTTNQITVTNGDGVSGNPTLSLPQDIHTGASPTFAGATLNSTLNMNDGRIDIPADNYTISDPPIKFIYPDMTDNEDSKGAIIEWGGVMDGASHPYGIATYAYQQNPAATFTAPSGYKKWAWVTAHYDSPLSTGEDVHQHLNLETVKADWLTAITRFQISFGEDIALASFPNSHVKVYPDKNFQVGSDSEGLFIAHDTANARINMTHKKPIRFQDGNTSSALTLDFSSGNPRLFSSAATNMYIGDSGGYLNFVPAAGSGSPKFSYERLANTSGSLFRITGVGMTGGAGITQYGLKIDPTYNQTSTASGIDLLIDRTQTAVGSGTQALIDGRVGGTSKFSVDNTGLVNGKIGDALALAPSGAIAETFSRVYGYSVSYPALTSGTLYVRAIYLPAGMPISNITFMVGNTAEAGGTNAWFCLLDSSRVVRAVSADQTGATYFDSTFTASTLSVSGSSYTTTYSGLYYVGVCVKATTMPTFLCGAGTQSALTNIAPILMASSSTAQTTPPTTGTTMGALTGNSSFNFYTYIS